MKLKNIDLLVHAYEFDNSCDFHEFVRKFKNSEKFFNDTVKIIADKLIKSEILSNFDFLLYIPNDDNLKTNYAKKIALQLSKHINKEVKVCIKKVKETKELKSLPYNERKTEIKGAFVSDIDLNAKICIIDDFFVSGATLEEVSKSLKKTGSSYIVAVVAAIYNI